jgi:hypothetical protein
MPCDIASGRTLACKDSVGGIKNVYIIPYANVEQNNVTYLVGTDTISALAAAPPNCYKYELKGASSLEQAITSSRDNGTTFFEQTLNLTLQKVDAATNVELKYLAWSRPVVVIEDYNDNLMVAGLENGMEVTGGTIVSGTAMGDLYGYTITMVGQERLPANFLDGIALLSVSNTYINP